MKTLHMILVLTILSGSLASQTILSVTHGTTTNGVLGTAVGRGPDWDGDGVPDVLAGAPEDPMFQGNYLPPPGTPPQTSPGNGRVEVISGATGNILHTVSGPFFQGRYGSSFSALGDVDGDGVLDVAVGAPNFVVFNGNVDVLSGATLLPIYPAITESTLPGTMCFAIPNSGASFGHAMAAGGDVTGDGISDLWIGAPYNNGTLNIMPSRIEVHSGADGSLVGGACGLSAAFPWNLGWSVAEPEDVNGDGVLDIIGSTLSQGSIRTFSGVDGSLINSYTGLGAFAITLIPDQDGDGVRDIAASEPSASFNATLGGGFRILSGATLATLNVLFGHIPHGLLGWSMDASGDFDGDGVKDLAVGAFGDYSGTPGYVEVYSGATLQLLAHITSPVLGNGFGTSVCFVGDLTGDGREELAVGALFEANGTMSLAGAVYIVKGLEPPASAFGNVGQPLVMGSEQVLTLNGLTGGASHRVQVPLGQPFTLAMNQPSTLTAPAGFTLFAAVGLPSAVTVYPTIFGNFGIIPQPAAPGNPLLFHVADSLGFGNPIIAATPAPWSVAVPSGLPHPLLVTFQGLIEDMPVPFPNNLAITNAVILDVQ